MVFENELMPDTSTMEGNMLMSDAPTYGVVSPDAIVETITFGTPIGSCCIAAVAIEVPPDPPIEKMPSKRPFAYSAGTSFFTPSVIVAVASARSRFSTSVERSMSTAALTSSFGTSGAKVASKMPQWMVSVLMPSCSKSCFT